MCKIAFYAAHRSRAQRFDARRFESIEYRASVDIDWCDARMERSVMVAQAKRRRVRGAARFGNQQRLKRGARRWDTRRLAGSRRHVGSEHDLDLSIVRNGAGCSGERSAEEVDLLGHSRPQLALPTTLSGRSSPNTR